MSYSYTKSGTDETEHGTDWTKDEQREELVWCDECNGYVRLPVGSCGHDARAKKANDEVVAKTKAKTIMAPIICSCGNGRCYAVGVFGHPEPIYAAEIRPISSGQDAKDRRALELKAMAVRQKREEDRAKAEQEELERGSVSWGN